MRAKMILLMSFLRKLLILKLVIYSFLISKLVLIMLLWI